MPSPHRAEGTRGQERGWRSPGCHEKSGQTEHASIPRPRAFEFHRQPGLALHRLSGGAGERPRDCQKDGDEQGRGRWSPTGQSDGARGPNSGSHSRFWICDFTKERDALDRNIRSHSKPGARTLRILGPDKARRVPIASSFRGPKHPCDLAPLFGASIDPDRRRLNAGGGFPSVRTDFGAESHHFQFHETRRQDCTGDRGDQRNRRIPLHREGTPGQVASLIVELVKNDYITGETFTIDGGLTMRIA